MPYTDPLALTPIPDIMAEAGSGGSFMLAAKPRSIKNTSLLLLLGVSLLLGGCTSSPQMVRRARELAILKTDRAFALAAVRHGLPWAYHRYFLRDALLIAARAEPIRGRHRILSQLPPGVPSLLTWSPHRALSSKHGLGVSWGNYEVTGRTTGGRPTIIYGSYVTLWKRHAGHWRVALEMQNTAPGPGSSNPAKTAPPRPIRQES